MTLAGWIEIFVVMIVTLLRFLPALALGPLAELSVATDGKVF